MSRRVSAALGHATLWPLLVALVAIAMAIASVSSARAAGPRVTNQYDAWQQAMAQLKTPGLGCFTGTYPAVKWTTAKCSPPQKVRESPAPGLGENPDIGEGNDLTAFVSPTLHSAIGSFNHVPSTLTECESVFSTCDRPDQYSIQINSNTFKTPMCDTSDNTHCLGWEQFVYNSQYHFIFIEYWLLYYLTPTTTSCPPDISPTVGWIPWGPDCYVNLNGPLDPAGAIPANQLGSTKLSGLVLSSTMDEVVLNSPGGHAFAATLTPAIRGLYGHWDHVQFGVYGAAGGSRAEFGPPGSTSFNVHVATNNGTTNAPSCLVYAYAAETNNLSFTGPPTMFHGTSPGMESTQSMVPGPHATCAGARDVGDTHLLSFRGLLYDFQATGDFLVASTGPGFVVQSRQVSGAPTWPNAAMNEAIGVKAGTNTVCLSSTALTLNGKADPLSDGATQIFAGGGSISRSSNSYLILGPKGDWVSARIMPGSPNYLDTQVGLAKWPEPVKGLLGGRSATGVTTSSGSVMASPFAFSTFYGTYTNGWRVAPQNSLLGPCSAKVANGAPKATLYPANLAPALAKASASTCAGEGVKGTAYLNACIVDVSVLKNKAAALIFVGLPTRITVGTILKPVQ
jgi:hypothetical protein